MFEKLDKHTSIGWDFDGTLFGHPMSPDMHQYILANPEKQHYIVTFRSGGWANDVWDDLAKYSTGLLPEHFSGLINMETEMFRENGPRLGRDAYPTDLYKTWKGEQCLGYGITVLIDDNPAHVTLGCDEHGIEFIDPDEFLEAYG